MKSILFLTWLTVNISGTKKSKFRPLENQGCFDEFPDCEAHVAKYQCKGREDGINETEDVEELELVRSLEALAFCRESCKSIYQNATQLPSIIELLGGVGDEIEDVFGLW